MPRGSLYASGPRAYVYKLLTAVVLMVLMTFLIRKTRLSRYFYSCP